MKNLHSIDEDLKRQNVNMHACAHIHNPTHTNMHTCVHSYYNDPCGGPGCLYSNFVDKKDIGSPKLIYSPVLPVRVYATLVSVLKKDMP